ncbi:alpha-2-macroglobulin [Polaribacter sp. SA4-10]|uniref:alpha-2-macroglobulin family protein n=1 Tax=Polaribacter sp. SA4-10 TaxID=754397 RepID=UPI000B3C0C8D|nr:MG2 domain-containing protein [Polaribacter sp. SA4-10]ARV07651.1 alpha-2-macroglobulin [Polaribacter sp. SA4-10]
MKKLITSLLIIILFSNIVNAQHNFKDLWLEVEKFEIDNLPKSALKIAEEIYAKAEKEKNSPQIIKSLFYKSKFSLILEEDAQLKVINSFKKHILKSEFPTKNILENVLATLYWQYFKQNRYKFYNRTKTEKKVDALDFRTWDLNTLFKEVHCYFEASLENSEQLQKTDIYDFSDILHIQKGSKNYKPTLYDFLANNALAFYKSSETSITRPSYKFTVDSVAYLSDLNTFSKLNLVSKDSLSLQFNALKVYQKLIEFHLKRNDLKALVDIDLHRINFVKQHATFNGKEDVLYATLKKSFENFKKNEVSGLYAFEISKFYREEASSYLNTKEEHKRFRNSSAIDVCNSIIKQFPKSLGAKKCTFLKSQITQKTISITTEEYIPINKNSRLLVQYKNVEKLFFTAYIITQEQLVQFNKTHLFKDRISLINSFKKTHTWHQKLRDDKDFLQHTTEVIVPKFNNGNYLILASEKEEINKENIYGTTTIQVTNLTLIENNFDGRYNYQIVDRNTGKPIKNAEIHVKNKKKNRGASINKKLITDKNGFASFKSSNYYQKVEISVKTKNDSTSFGNLYLYKNSSKDYKKNERALIKSFIFTDRSIYRPGQTVYFKAIVIQKKGEKSEVLKNKKVDIRLFDVHHQEIKKINLTLNEFGSVSGEFILPNNGLTGQYLITSKPEVLEQDNKVISNFDYNHYSFSVEEYKRPKFETEFKPIKESFKLNDSVTVKGFAKAFSGASITDAKVVYRVSRKVQYPNWWFWRRPGATSEAQEITHGEGITNEKGEFKIVFKAMPDESVSKASLPIFNYEITADVTDINGESHSATNVIKIGYHSLLASISLDTKIDKNTKNNILKVDTKNLNGEFVSAKGTLKIYKLLAPKNPLRKRVWSAPDYQDISETTFRALFPNEAYTDEEADENNWKKGALVFSSYFDTEIAKEIKLANTKNWISGKYIILLESQDKFGQAVKDQQKFEVFSLKEKEVADNKLFVIQTDKTSYKPNDVVKLQIGSASKNITVIVQIEKDHKVIETCLVKLNNTSKTIKIPVKKEDIGGFAIKYHFVNYNYFKSGSVLINVHQEQENIQIETNIFRDKLLPGQNETWSFTVKNDKNNKVAAEVLASMYDASLDQFKPHDWNFNPITSKGSYYSYNKSNANHSFKNSFFNIRNNQRNDYGFPSIHYDAYNWFGFYFGRNRNIMIRRMASTSKKGKAEEIQIVEDEMEVEESIMMSSEAILNEIVVTNLAPESKKLQEKISLEGIKIRKNFQETAFFFPKLRTDKNGQVSFNFTIPEALTRWKLQLLAHTKDLKSATKTLTTVTQKELMVVPNAPRFLREGDKITFSAKISNLTNNSLSGFAQLELTDLITGKEIDIDLNNIDKNKNFDVDKDGNTSVSWNLSIPETVQAVQYKIVAKAGAFSDGEQNALPVLSNRMLVTETLPMWIGSNQTKTFTLDKLKNNASSTLKNHKLTLEMTSNPVWYAIQSLPYLMEYPYECAEQTFSKYYANTLASFVANSNPKIQEVFNAWKSSDALLSNLEKNQELKSLILQETPWLRDAQSETEQKKRIALLFDSNKMKNEQEKAINKLKSIQMNSGGFPWFKGSRFESTFITQHIATGFGHLQKLGVTNFDESTSEMIEKSVKFLDGELLEQYEKLLKKAEEKKQQAKTKKEGEKKYKAYLEKNNLGYFTIQYLYMRSFYTAISLDDNLQKAVEYYKNQSVRYWNEYNLYAKGQIALSLFRADKKTVANKILKSLEENSITSDELGMYWKSNTAGYYYYQAPIETQALMIEVFSEIHKDKQETIDNLKIWLLKNKQTNRWKTTKATTEAVYALLLNGSDWISITEMVDIKVGDKAINPSEIDDVKIEAGTGYFKTSWNGTEITPKMSEVTITKKGNGIAWGGLYWQYFEDLDKITSAETPLKLNKKLFLKVNPDTGKELKEINPNTQLKVGDLITVRIELRSDRNMEFIHMKDMRASGVEPINVLSKYKYQDSLGYYESTKDAATNFFFERLPKGVYVFEYDVRVNNAGEFSNGITTIQSMYAPEFSSHSEGVRINVQEK